MEEDAAGGAGECPVWAVVREEKIAGFLYETLSRGDTVQGREFWVGEEGNRHLLSISVSPLVTDGRVTGSVVLSEDITAKRKSEAELHRVENLASMTNLAAGVAHEIKNPLASISIHNQLVKKGLDAAREKYREAGETPLANHELIAKHINIVNEEIDRLNRIVMDFLFAVRPMNMSPTNMCVNDVVNNVVELVKDELDEKKITLVLKLDEKTGFVLMDERLMKQAVLNLVKNAMDAIVDNEKNSTELKNDSKPIGTITLKTGLNKDWAEITVKDTGPGISKENLGKVFEPYFTTKPAGTGLGLTLVFKIAKEHKGELLVRSTEGHGAAFIIRLPLTRSAQGLIENNKTAG
jgi:signal transduction histidine kinase